MRVAEFMELKTKQNMITSQMRYHKPNVMISLEKLLFKRNSIKILDFISKPAKSKLLNNNVGIVGPTSTEHLANGSLLENSGS